MAYPHHKLAGLLANVMVRRMPYPIPDSVDALLMRDQNAAALTAAGFPIKAKTLATKASRGGGPPFRKWSGKPLYRWGDSLAWAESRLSPLRGSTSEDDARLPKRSAIR